MSAFAKKHPEFKTSRLKLQPGLAWKTGLKPGSLDMVVDRSTLRYIQYANNLLKKFRPLLIQKTIEHYISLIKKEGKVVLLFKKVYSRELMADVEVEHIVRPFLREKVRQGIIDVEEVPIMDSRFKLGESYFPPTYKMQTALVITKK